MLTPPELKLERLYPKPPVVEDCSDIDRVLKKLRRPEKIVDKRPPQSIGRLTSDEIEIYRAVLGQWVAEDHAPLNVSLQTYPLETRSSSGSAIPCKCLSNIDPMSLFAASRSVHILNRDVLPLRSMRLLDFSEQTTTIQKHDPANLIRDGKSVDIAVAEGFGSGVFSLSEIAFDKVHRHAIVSYGFQCGMLCGSGLTIVFEKVGNGWKRASLECGGWIS